MAVSSWSQRNDEPLENVNPAPHLGEIAREKRARRLKRVLGDQKSCLSRPERPANELPPAGAASNVRLRSGGLDMGDRSMVFGFGGKKPSQVKAASPAVSGAASGLPSPLFGLMQDFP